MRHLDAGNLIRRAMPNRISFHHIFAHLEQQQRQSMLLNAGSSETVRETQQSNRDIKFLGIIPVFVREFGYQG